MQPDELHAVMDLFAASWSGSLTLADREVWAERFEKYPRTACMKAIRTAADSIVRRPSWAEMRPLLSSASTAPRVACEHCVNGFIETPDGHSVEFCARCRPDQHHQQRAGAFAPSTHSGPPVSVDLDRDTFQRSIDEARGELIKKGIS